VKMSLAQCLDRETFAKILKLSDKDILEKLICSDDTASMERILRTDFILKDHALIHYIESYGMLCILLRLGLDLSLAFENDLATERGVWIIQFLMSAPVAEKRLLKIDLNRCVNNKYGTPLWRALLCEQTVKLGYLSLLTNFLSNDVTKGSIDINAQDSDGDTYLHANNTSYPEIFELEPNIYIKNNVGMSVKDIYKRYYPQNILFKAYYAKKKKNLLKYANDTIIAANAAIELKDIRIQELELELIFCKELLS